MRKSPLIRCIPQQMNCLTGFAGVQQFVSLIDIVLILRPRVLAGKLARINGEANVIESDVSASNGVVHFIDRILTDILF